MLASVRLEERSLTACAVTTWRDQLYLAWTGADGHINLAWSEDGRAITGRQRLAQQSAVFAKGHADVFAPAVAGSGARLCLAWRGKDGSINVCDAEHPDHPRPVTFKERNARSPSLTATGSGGQAVAWTGADNRVYLSAVTEDPSGESLRTGARSRFDAAKSYHEPAVCRHEHRLILAWIGTDRRINLLTVAGSGPGAPTRLEEARSSSAPALCSHQGRLILAWTGTDRRINLASVQ